MDQPSTYGLVDDLPVDTGSPALREGTDARPVRRFPLGRILLFDILIAVCVLHGWVVWIGLGGREGLNSGWPVLASDHPLYYYSATVTRSFLDSTATTAGYDPAFMSGYPKSLIWPSSSTLPELVVYFFGGDKPEFAYKLYLLVSVSLFPWLIWLVARSFGAGLDGCLVAVSLALVYFWTDFPSGYATYGMIPYLLSMPIALLATKQFDGFVQRGGLGRWLVVVFLSNVCFLVHFTCGMIVVPAVLAVYLAAAVWNKKQGRQFPVGRHLGVWLIPITILLFNAFWWWPGVPLWDTRGDSAFAFNHPERIGTRFVQMMTVAPEVESCLVACGLFGLVVFFARSSISAIALLVFTLAGFCWGYLAGAYRSLDWLQPGRHSYAFYLGLAVASGIGWDEVARRLRAVKRYLPFFAYVCLALVGTRMFAQRLDIMLSRNMARSSTLLHELVPTTDWPSPHGRFEEPFLSSKPSPLLLWTVDRIKQYVKPGERVLYEESGFEIPGEADPYQGQRFSPLLPERCGVEVIGGPYLHASLTTNFTQFGENMLFGKKDWDREFFVAHAKLYRPAAIVCWTRKAKAFCESYPDLIEIKEVEPRSGVLIGRIKGFEGAAIRGGATVKAEANRLTITDIKPDVDGLAVLRYHSVPCLRSLPEGLWQPVKLEGDPVPFIGVKASAVPIVIEMAIPPPWRSLSK